MAGWADAFEELSAAHREARLQVEDLERLAVAAYMVGKDDDCEEAWTAAHNAWLRRGEAERAARCAFWQALGLFFRGDLAPAMGWVGRGGRLLEDGSHDCVEQAWLRMLTALPLLFDGDGAGTRELRRGGRDRRALRRRRRDDVRAALPGLRTDPAGPNRPRGWRCWTRSWSPSRQTRSRRCSRGSRTAR